MIENNFLVSVETVNRLRRYSDNVLRASNYKDQRRSITDGVSNLSLIFKDNNELEYSENGIGNLGSWNLVASNTLILEIGSVRLWYKPLYISKALLILYSEINHKYYCFVSEGYDIPSIEQYYERLNHEMERQTHKPKIQEPIKINPNELYWLIGSVLGFILLIYIIYLIKLYIL